MASGIIYGSTDNQYIDSKIEWSSTPNNSANTSTVTAKLYYKRNNTGYTTSGTGSFTLSIDGQTQTVSAYLSIGTSWVLAASASKTISHNGDGTKAITISATGSIPSTTLTSTACSGRVSLDTIPRASTISLAYAVTVGNKCKIVFTPASASFWYKIVFSIGSFSSTTEAFCPGVTSAYTYTGYAIPYDVADYFPNDPSGTMTATLYTFPSKTAEARIGSTSTKPFTVTLPENTYTKPSLTMTLTPDTPYEKFASLYIQGRSKVKATFVGSGKYKASISSYGMQVDGVSYASPYVSDILRKSGNVNIVGTVTDSRGFSGSASGSINVIAYDPPYIAPSSGNKKVICERCTSDGTASDTGTFLHIKGTRNYTKINVNGIVNTCSVRCRYKPEGGSWSHGSGSGVGVLMWTDTTTDSFDVILPNIVTDIKKSYLVELNIIDDTYLPSTMEFSIPSENVDFELREGGKGAGFGKHATAENLLDVGWDAKFNEVTYLNSLYLIEKEITVDGDKDTYYPVHIEPIPLEKYTSINTQPAFLGLGKILNSKAPNWEGNHSTANSSSISAAWLFRYMGWDGNGDYIIPLYKREGYAKILAHIQGLNQAATGVVLYLRGGGATYKIVCSIPFTPKVFLSETNISASSAPDLYPVIVTPRAYEGNKGINFSNGVVSDFVIEQAQAGMWYYRKWYSGRAECWGTATFSTSFTTTWGSLYVSSPSERKNYPFAFVERPNETATMRTGGVACFAFAESGGKGLNTITQTAIYSAARPTVVTEAYTIYIDYHVCGRWK